MRGDFAPPPVVVTLTSALTSAQRGRECQWGHEERFPLPRRVAAIGSVKGPSPEYPVTTGKRRFRTFAPSPPNGEVRRTPDLRHDNPIVRDARARADAWAQRSDHQKRRESGAIARKIADFAPGNGRISGHCLGVGTFKISREGSLEEMANALLDARCRHLPHIHPHDYNDNS
jgi:hypothetical protein